MFREALESVLRVSLRVSSCVCRQPSSSDSVYLAEGPLVVCFPPGFAPTRPHKPRWEARREVYCHTNKRVRDRDPEKVQWESRCQFSHAALMGARRVNISSRVFPASSFFLLLLLPSSSSPSSSSLSSPGLWFLWPPQTGEGSPGRREVGKVQPRRSHWVITTQTSSYRGSSQHMQRILTGAWSPEDQGWSCFSPA